MTFQTDEDSDNIHWNVQREILLFHAMMGYKPVGVNRYFMMTLIHNRLTKSLNRQITCEPIWRHFDTMYDMAALHESEIIPFPNEEVEFELPEDFDTLAFQRFGIPLLHSGKMSKLKPNSFKSEGKKISLNKSKSNTPVSSGKINGGSSGKMSVNKAIKNESDDESDGANSTKMEMEHTGKNVKSKRSSASNTENKSRQESGSPMKGQHSSESQSRRSNKSDTPTQKKVTRDSRSNSVESTKRSRESSSSSKKGKHVSNAESPGSRRSIKVEVTPSKRKFESSSSNERNSSTKSEKADRRTDSESQSSIGATKSPRVSAKMEQDSKRRTRVKTEEAPQKNTPTTKRRR